MKKRFLSLLLALSLTLSLAIPSFAVSCSHLLFLFPFFP